jgi:hypothetical protein
MSDELDIKPYDPTGLKSTYQEIDKEVDRKIWLTNFMPAFTNAFYYSLAVLEIIIIFGGLFYIAYYLTFGIQQEREQLASIVVNIETQSQAGLQSAAQSLIVGEGLVFPSTGDRSDYLARLENPNNNWLAEFQYFFTTPSGNTTPKRGYILPGRVFYLNDLGSTLQTNSRTATPVIEDLAWYRISPSTIPDLEDWLAFRESIEITDISHGGSVTIADTEIVQTTFNIFNDTPFSYWDVDLLVLLTQGRNIIAANQIRLAGLDTGENRSVTVNWFGNVSRAASVQIIPQINFFNPQIYRANPIDSVQEIRNSF